MGLLNEEENKGSSLVGVLPEDSLGECRMKQALLKCLKQLEASGKSLAAYGASAKEVPSEFFGINHSHLAFVADRGTYKQGRLTPGTHIPIVLPNGS
jgi:methylation protein EvaC